MADKVIRIGTRGSNLALRQTEIVSDALSRHTDCRIEVVIIKTTGDRFQKTSTAVRDKKEWILEIEQALLDSSIDIALHSGKDIPADISADTALLSVTERAEPADICVFSPGEVCKSFFELPKGSVVGTSSLRRGAQCLAARPDLKIVPIRGNVETRLAKLDASSEMIATILAGAGVQRLGLTNLSSMLLPVDTFVPAVNQGVLVAQFMRDNEELRTLLREVSVPVVEAAFLAERAVVRGLGADCQSSMGVFATLLDNELLLRCQILSADGAQVIEGVRRTTIESAEAVGGDLAHELLSRGASELL